MCGATELLVGPGMTPTATFEVDADQESDRSYFEPFRTYNPDHIAQEVAGLLSQWEPKPMVGMYEGSLLRRRGASMLLRGHGIMSSFKAEDWLALNRGRQDCR
ncbi:MAG: hypothetical protein GEU97_22000 [Actinophytocola sp.]|nr:hypothetical protein [Actinophytocola sp.]